MSLIPHSFMPRSQFNTDLWHPSTLDAFDPFDDLDRELSRNMQWLDRPSLFNFGRVPHKYRVCVDCQGYHPDSIKTEVKHGQLHVSAHEGKQADKEDEDYNLHEFHRTYTLPENVEAEKMVSFLTNQGQLVVEMPLKESDNELHFGVSTAPHIVDGKDGEKRVEVSMGLPSHIDPSKINVSCKDHDLIVQLEDKDVDSNHSSQVYFYQRTTLPEDTDFKALQCTQQGNKLVINAPLNASNALKGKDRPIPIEAQTRKHSR